METAFWGALIIANIYLAVNSSDTGSLIFGCVWLGIAITILLTK